MDPITNSSDLTFRSSLGVIRKTLGLAWRLDKVQVCIYLLGAISEITGTLVSTYAGAKLIGLLFDAITHKSYRASVWDWLIITIIGQLAVNVGFWLMNYGRRIIYILASKWSSYNFLKQLCNIDIQTFHDTDNRNLINKLDSGHGWQISQVTSNAMDLTYGCVRAIAIVAVIATVAWWVAPFLILFLIPSLIAESKTAKAGWFVWDEKGDERHVFWGIAWLMNRANKQLEIRALQAKDFLLNHIEKMLNKFQLKQRRILKNANKVIGPAKVFEIIGIAITEIWLIWRVIYKYNLGITPYIFYSGIIARISGALNTIVSTYTQMQEPLLYANDFYNFQTIQPKIESHDEDGIKVDTNKVPEIKFKNVWFRYPGSSQWVFEDLSLTIKPGEHIAMVGENGAGKTTLVKLLLRFYDVERGSIEINGQDIKALSISSWYKQVGTLFQDFNAYPLDIKKNITLNDKKIDVDKLNKALEDSEVDSIVESLPFGIETVLDSSFKKGVEPSGGQWQRVALARAFYRDSNVLILDEPTAAIDARAEYKIFNSIFEHQSDKTTIIISHRFSTVRRADRIVVLQEGKVVEEGKHEELMKHTDGLYRDMFSKQAEGYR